MLEPRVDECPGCPICKTETKGQLSEEGTLKMVSYPCEDSCWIQGLYMKMWIKDEDLCITVWRRSQSHPCVRACVHACVCVCVRVCVCLAFV